MANVENLIHSLIQRTKDKKLLYAEYKDGYFVLLNVEPEILLIAFPTLDARVKSPLNSQYQFQTELVRLSNLAARQHPNVEDFIDEFLADKD